MKYRPAALPLSRRIFQHRNLSRLARDQLRVSSPQPNEQNRIE